jgi:pyridoxal phosphate enzyme (YggS family)
METTIRENVTRVRERVHAASARVGRSLADVTIVAITKTHGADIVDAVVDAGIPDVGENRIQEWLLKKPQTTRPCRWHLVGTLQRNKAGKAIGEFELIHSVDRLSLAETLARLGRDRGVVTPILLEVNTSGEATKHGFAPADVAAAAEGIAALDGLRLDGLMTIGPLTEDATSIRRAFQSLFRLRDKLERALGHALPHLSMGMSDDFEIAVEEGATLVRLGRVLFGERRPQ